MNFSEKVASLLSVALENFPDIFLVDFKVSADNSIKIILDGDKDVNVKDCINISREIEGSLDREVEDFSLEVASAGVGSALKFPRQYYKIPQCFYCFFYVVERSWAGRGGILAWSE